MLSNNEPTHRSKGHPNQSENVYFTQHLENRKSFIPFKASITMRTPDLELYTNLRTFYALHTWCKIHYDINKMV